MNNSKFDYEAKVWGATDVRTSPFYIQGLKLQYTLDDLKSVKGKVLDVGCGGGNMAKAIKHYRPDLSVYGADISKKAIAMAKQNAKNITFTVAPAEKLPFPDNTFDAIVMYDILEHLEKPELALHEAKRVLKKDGIMHIFSPLDGQPGTLYDLVFKIGWQPKNQHTGHLQVFSDKKFEELLKKEKIVVTKKRFSFHWIFSFFDLLYFTFLEIFKVHPPSSIEGMVGEKKRNPLVVLFNLFYRCVIALGYLESRLLSRVSGGGGHFTTKISSSKK